MATSKLIVAYPPPKDVDAFEAIYHQEHVPQVGDILLPPGQYVFRLTKPDVDHSVVSIYNAQTNRLERTIIGLPAYRLAAADKHAFTVSQSQAGQPAKLQTWFYPGDNFGWSFGGR
jgi:hypothetical protein